MRKPKVHCKNCKYFLKNKESKRAKPVNINPLMLELINTSREVKYDGVCIRSGNGVYIENKCKLWKYKSQEKVMRYTPSKNLDNYECDNQINIKDILK